MATAATARADLRAVLLRPVPLGGARWARRAIVAGVLFGAAAVAVSALIHLHLWLIGYKHIHLIGPAFLFQAVSGLLLALALAGYRRVVLVASGVAFLAGSAAALFLSATVGFLGLHDGLSVPWAGWSLASELSGALVLALCLVRMLRAR